MTSQQRRDFLKLAAGAATTGAALSLLPPAIARALAVPARSVTGTIKDVGHVVILMQENRSFDHYFGTLRGVRGFGDRHPIPLPGGAAVWDQPYQPGYTPFRPFRLDTRNTSAQRVPDLNHGWADSIRAANHGRWDQWVPSKVQSGMPGLDGTGYERTPRLGLTMGYYHREDIPFQFALAEAFTLCDAYHCSIFGSTTPNRIFSLTGGNDPHGRGGGPVIDNVASMTPRSRADIVPSLKGGTDYFTRGYGLAPRYTFTTYPERLERAGISWKLYQNADDNMGGTLNGLVAFDPFAFAERDSSLWKRGMANSTLEDLKRDVLDGTLPQVSWIVPTAVASEHPYSSTPIQGAEYTQQVLDALTANPEVWAKTVFLVIFDEADGFFDHVPPPAVPAPQPDGTLAGASTVDTSGEIHQPDQTPYGLGPRLPAYVISPWSKGGWVNSQVFDHTSVIRFLEARFGVIEPNITPWRRAVCGDLTSAFDFANPDRGAHAQLPDVSRANAIVEIQSRLPVPAPPIHSEPLFQEPGTRASRALPYELHVDGRSEGSSIELALRNTGKAAAVFHVYDKLHLDRIPRRYTVEAGKELSGRWDTAADKGAYHLWVYGPNGFVREFRGELSQAPYPQLRVRYEVKRAMAVLIVSAPQGTRFTVKPNAYLTDEPRALQAASRGRQELRWNVGDSGNWYDFTISTAGVEHRFAGRIETGRPGVSDPAVGV